MKPITIAVDFDGTCVGHAYPAIGKDIGAVPVLKALAAKGHKLILWTMRSGPELQAAVQWWKDNHIPLYGVNANPDQDWSTSPKCYAQIYIDDAALGCPLRNDPDERYHPFVDWDEVEKQLAPYF